MQCEVCEIILIYAIKLDINIYIIFTKINS